MFQYNDQPTPEELLRQRQMMLDQRGNTVFRNVGPDDLTTFPDKNAQQPNDLMLYRMLFGGNERI